MFGLWKKPKPTPGKLDILKAAQLQPRIKHMNFLKALHDIGVPPGQFPTNSAICGELLVTYAFDLPDSFIMVTPEFLEQVGVKEADLPQLALENLQRVLPQPQFFNKDRTCLIYTGQDLEATLLLIDAFWSEAQTDFQGEMLVTAPRRDRVLMCDGGDAGALAALRLHTSDFFKEHQDVHMLSTQIMRRRGQKWCLFENH